MIIDDNSTLRRSMELALQEEGYEVSTAASGREGLNMVKNGFAELVFLDLKLPDGSGIDVLHEIKEFNDDIVVVVITAYGRVESAVQAMKLGAYDYITKPFEIEEIKFVIKKSLENLNLKNQIRRDINRFDSLIGKSAKMKTVYDIIEKVVRSEATTVLIEGETGTGKGLVARTLHNNSHRKEMPFVDINCSSIPEPLIESELFGYERGAFTDAVRLKKGLIEQADGGTLFLDEVGDLRPSIQVKLLKIIDEKIFRRVGGIKDIKVNVRIVTATNKNLKELVEEGQFREDLYYRLKVVPVYTPALRERKEDIPLLADYFLQKFTDEFKKKPKSISPKSMNLLIDYRWPGNVRELKNTLERICLLEDSATITPDQLFLSTEEPQPSEIPKQHDLSGMSLAELERYWIQRTLEQVDYNKSRAATILGVSRQTLRKKLNLT
jgi:DNA-binding NtrC family response regulator